jgi:mono/diheme cytochrome c family protein
VRRTSSGRFLIVLLVLVSHRLAWAEADLDVGEQAFNTTCFACHTIGGGKRVGPDLAGIQDKRSSDWLTSFIRSSQSMVREGDVAAIAIVDEYNGMIMPDAVLSDDQINSVVAYIAAQSVTSSEAGAVAVQASEPEPLDNPAQSAEQVSRGRALFDGRIDFANGGPTCNACHHVTDDAVFGGGNLAAELTTVFSRMSAAGVKAIIAQAPFPAMQTAYADKPLTENEVADLTTYLQAANTELPKQTPRDYGMRLLLGGVVGSTALFGVCGLVWRGRKRGSVNQDIYDRQLKSE